MRVRYRRAFTLIELLVVIAVLIALLLPAVQQAREAARRTQCKNNLKQLGLALHNYHDIALAFPPGIINPEFAGNPNLSFGWNAMILPQIDQAPLFNQINFSSNMPAIVAGIPNPAATVIPAVRCPSDVGSPLVAFVCIVPAWGIVGVLRPNAVGRSNYPAVVGCMQVPNSSIFIGINDEATLTTARYRGAFAKNSKVGIQDMTDGSSNVLMVGERYTPSEAGLSTDIYQPFGHTAWFGTGAPGLSGPAMVLGDVASSNSTPDNATDAEDFVGRGSTSTAAYTLNGNNTSAVPRGQTSGFGSMHTGGAHFLFGDGTVRFVSQNIDLGVYRNLGTINDGNPIGQF